MVKFFFWVMLVLLIVCIVAPCIGVLSENPTASSYGYLFLLLLFPVGFGFMALYKNLYN